MTMWKCNVQPAPASLAPFIRTGRNEYMKWIMSVTSDILRLQSDPVLFDINKQINKGITEYYYSLFQGFQ